MGEKRRKTNLIIRGFHHISNHYFQVSLTVHHYESILISDLYSGSYFLITHFGASNDGIERHSDIRTGQMIEIMHFIITFLLR